MPIEANLWSALLYAKYTYTSFCNESTVYEFEWAYNKLTIIPELFQYIWLD